MAKTFVLVEVEDNMVSDVNVIGTGDVEAITIDWDVIQDDLDDIDDALLKVSSAVGELLSQGVPCATGPLGIAREKLQAFSDDIHGEEDEEDEEEDEDIDADDDDDEEWEEEDRVELGPEDDGDRAEHPERAIND